ncbi:MAG TPA: hypothetical protein VMS09_03580 [Paenibacillus sp.]|uniref:hypothetical protein n=1 Tax=Paenibacillus sp. TaxID=58172 RepID=UPI0028D4312F|nr:hypothetical protein [Paenibacillus sp.]HUC91094.1 hypothetical protein [Paenibacillus sp.]
MDCPICQGNGELECRACDSAQTERSGGGDCGCDHCRGTSLISCHRCEGSGYLEQYA